ncbi:hypothetical protein [Yersinia alsatica]|uniref:hypothetical protein n=1 Tax=Yersinia alsatica TaxID=2890317 RepID=UPI0011AA378F|nr:hypothetical protein [Yersinia alsatica]
MELETIGLVCVMYATAIWVLLHGIRGFQTGVIIEPRKGSPIKDYYYRGGLGFYVNVFMYIVAGTWMIGFATWFLMTALGYW